MGLNPGSVPFYAGPPTVSLSFFACDDRLYASVKVKLNFMSFFFFNATPYSIWDLSSLIELKTTELGAQNLNHWPAREAPMSFFFPTAGTDS